MTHRTVAGYSSKIITNSLIDNKWICNSLRIFSHEHVTDKQIDNNINLLNILCLCDIEVSSAITLNYRIQGQFRSL